MFVGYLLKDCELSFQIDNNVKQVTLYTYLC